MTYEEALQIAIEELDDVVRELRMDNWGHEKIIEAECKPLVSARNVLCKALEDDEKDRLRAKKKEIYEDLKDAVDREWVGLTRDEFKLATGECLNEEDYWEAIESKLKEKNT